jgi:hypothetical protein
MSRNILLMVLALALQAPALRALECAAGDSPSVLTATEKTEIGHFIERHAELLNTGEIGKLMQLYAEDFRSDAYWDSFDRARLEGTYRQIYEHRHPQVKPYIGAIDKLGDCYAVSVCGMYSTDKEEGDPLKQDDWCQVYILVRKPEGLSIVRLYDADHRAFPYASPQSYHNDLFGFSFARPPNFFLIHQGARPGLIDSFRLVDSTLGADIQVTVYPALLVAGRDNSMAMDTAYLKENTDHFQVTREPMHFFTRTGLEGVLTEASFSISESSSLAHHIPQHGDYEQSRIYLSPDDRVLFSLTFQAPPPLHDKLFPAFFGLAKSLAINGKLDPTRYWEQVTSHLDWGTLESHQFYDNEKLSLSFVVPDGWLAEILPTGNRLNCVLVQQKSPRFGQMDLVVSDLAAPEESLDTLVGQRLAVFKSAGLEVVNVLQHDTRTVLDRSVVDLRLEIASACGNLVYRIIYLRTATKLYAFTLKAVSAEACDHLGADFQDWVDGFEISDN